MKPPKPKGIDFNKEEIKNALVNNHPLMLMLDFSQKCNLSCKYCFNANNKARETKDELNYQNYIDIINQAANFEIKTIFIPGSGEPTIDNNFWKVLPLIHKLNITPIMFTNGYTLTKKQIERLYENNTTIGLKLNSFNSETQNWLVDRIGYAKRRDMTLSLLIKQGFNKTDPTRLWLDTLVCKQNFNEIKDIFIYARKNNLWPGINTLFHMGSGNKKEVKEELDVPIDNIKKLWHELSKFDKKEYGYEWAPRPPYIAWDCNFYYFSMYINNKGNVSKCLGSPIIGLILDDNQKVKKDILKTYWNSKKMKKLTCIDYNIDKMDNNSYGCPCRRALKYGEDSTFILNPKDNIWKSNI